MKIKEVCKRTGLTERTIRYYVEEGLVKPETSLKGSREYREYNEQDLAELETVAGLRKLFFTIDEIKDMNNNPERIEAVLEAYKLKLASDARSKAAIVEALNQLGTNRLQSASDVAQKLRRLSDGLSLPQRDINPNFGRFEPGSKEEREQEYNRFVEKQARQYTRGRAIVFAIAGINVLLTFFAFFYNLNIINLIIQVVFSICLALGIRWVRYLFIAGAGISVLRFVAPLFWAFSEGLLLIAFLIVLYIAYAIASCLLLIRSEAVSEFLYTQKNG
ncbi:MerR family transcriptional regulator [Paenibacillus sp. CAU 1782]